MNSHSRKINTVIRPVTDKYSFERSVAGGHLLLAALVVVAVIVIRWIMVLS